MRLIKEDTIAILIDFQEKLVPVISSNEQIIKKAVVFAKGLEALKVPFVISQQYTKGLGETVSPLKEAVSDQALYMEKTTFSCLGCEEIAQWIKEQGKKTILVCGVEAHICVLQTVVDLLGEGYQVFVVADCIGSRDIYDKEIGIERMKKEGAFLTTCEASLFELTGGAKSPDFKVISKLVK